VKDFPKSVAKIKVSLKSDKNNGTSHGAQYAFFLSLLAQFSLESEMFQTKVVEKIKTHISCSKLLFFESHAVYEIMWQNIVQPARPPLT